MSAKKEEQQRTKVIKKTMVIDASPEIVFKAITDPNELTEWFPDEAMLEAKVGGKVRFVTLKKTPKKGYQLDRDYIMEGTILDLLPNRKLSYMWTFNDVPGFPETIVSWELDEVETNRTGVELTHSGFTGKEKGLTSFESHNQGWDVELNELAKYCKGKMPSHNQ